MKNFDKTWPSEKGNGKTLQYSCCQTLWTVRKGKKPWHWKMSLPGWMEGVQYVIGEEWRAITNSSRKEEWSTWANMETMIRGQCVWASLVVLWWNHLQYLRPPAIPCNTRDPGLIPQSRRSPGEGNGSPLQYSFLENPLGRGAWSSYSPWNHKRVGHDLTTKTKLK